MDRDIAAFRDAGVDAYAGQTRFAIEKQAAGLRHKIGCGILGVNPRLDRVSAQADVRRVPGKRLARGHKDLRAHKIEPRHFFGDRMLHLQARVHLEEIEGRLTAAADQELDGAGVDIPCRPGGSDRRCRHSLAQRRRQNRRRALLDDLLMAPLDRAIALEQVNDSAAAVAEHLHLDMMAPLDQALDIQRAVAERRDRFTACRLDGIERLAGIGDPTHPLAAAARGRLDKCGQADSLERLRYTLV